MGVYHLPRSVERPRSVLLSTDQLRERNIPVIRVRAPETEYWVSGTFPEWRIRVAEPLIQSCILRPLCVCEPGIVNATGSETNNCPRGEW